MNWTKLAIFGGLAAGAYYALNYFAGGIQYAFSGIKMLGFDGLKLKVSVRYSVTNRNDISASVTGLNGRIFYGGYELNEINLAKTVTIAPGATEEIDLRFTISPGSLLSEILRFFENKDKTFRSFVLKGTMTGKIGAVPFAYPLREQLRLAE